MRIEWIVLSLSGPGGWDTRADFNLRELRCYLSNTEQMLPLLLKFIEEQDSAKNNCLV